MCYERYAVSVAYINPYIYILGGRGYQTDELALLCTCERFNLEENKWE